MQVSSMASGPIQLSQRLCISQLSRPSRGQMRAQASPLLLRWNTCLR